jgi:hypothetical protein
MTTRALLFSPEGHRDWDVTRESLRKRAIQKEFTVNGEIFYVVVEPLIKKGSDGKLLQTIRVRSAANKNVVTLLGKPIVSSQSGSVLTQGGEDAPKGSYRVFVPEVDAEQQMIVSFEKNPQTKVNVLVKPQRHWTIHLVHHTHLDIGYTDPQGRVLAEHLAFLDSCLDLINRTDNWPEDAKFRWSVEALWSFDEWTKVRSKEKIDEFIRRVKEGRIELTAMPYNLHSETCSTDELHELLRLARDVSKQYGVEIPAAMQTDVPGAVVGLTDVLAENKVKYLSVAHNWAGRSVPHLVGGQDQPQLFRWVGPSGKGVLVWVTDTPHGLAYMEGPMIGFNDGYEWVDDLLPAYLQSNAEHPYPYPGGVFGWAVDNAEIHRKPYPWDILHLRIQGQFADNAPPRYIMAETVKRWNESWVYPKLRLSTNRDFFEDAEKRIGDQIQTIEGDWTDWWVEGVGSGARPNAMVRNAQINAADAQTVGALASFYGSVEGPDITKGSEVVYANASLFDEHTWGAANPWTIGDEGMDSGDQQWHWKYAKALAADDEGEVLLDRACSHLGDVLSTAPGALASFYISNTAVWSRSDEVVIFLPESRVPLETAIKIVDSRSKKELSFYESGQVNPKHRNAGRFIHILINDVPAIGVVRIDVLTGSKGKDNKSQLKDELVLENEFLKVAIDAKTSSVTSIYSKSIKREIVRQDSVVGFNAYIYDEYASSGGFNHQSGRTEGNTRLDLLATRSLTRPGVVIDSGVNDVKEWVTIESQAPGSSWIRTTYSLNKNSDRLDINNRIFKEATMTKESGYFAFPFALENPVTRVELSGGMSGSGLPLVPGSALHMRAARRWVSFEDNEIAVAVALQDAPLIQLGGVALPYAPFPPTMGEPEPATVYSWVYNNIWDTNFPSQQGFEMNFRYSVGASKSTGSGSGPALGARVAVGQSRRLRSSMATGTSNNIFEQDSLISVNDSRVRVIGLTSPKSGYVLVRLQSFAEEKLTLKMNVHKKLSNPVLATILGEEISPLSVTNDVVEVPLGKIGVTGVLFRLS